MVGISTTAFVTIQIYYASSVFDGKKRMRLAEAASAAIRDRQGGYPAGSLHRGAEGGCV